MRMKAPAKVNLFLRVLGVRDDGYHSVVTCLHALELGDDLALEAGSDGVSLEIHSDVASGMPVEAGPDNLVCRAAELYREHTGMTAGMRFVLHKRIPAGAGLGGGSSDAAAALTLANEWNDSALSETELCALGSRLGADVPFFIRGGTQVGSGVGDVLQTVTSPPRFHFVLLLPPYGVSTAEVYAHCGARRLTGSDHGNTMSAPPSGWSREDLELPERFVNDLEAAAMRIEPRLESLRNRVIESGYPHVRMSGSGSTLFVTFDDAAAAEQACAELKRFESDGVTLVRTRSCGAAGDSQEQ